MTLLVPAAAPPPAPAADPRLAEAARSLEAMFVERIVSTSGAFGGGEGPGAAIRAEQFSRALADAVTRQGGGLGIAAAITGSLGAGPAVTATPAAGVGSDPSMLELSPRPGAPAIDRTKALKTYSPRADALLGATLLPGRSR